MCYFPRFGIYEIVKALLPLARERIERILSFAPYDFGLSFAAGQLFARLEVIRDVFPQREIFWIRPASRITHRNPRNFYDS